MQGWRIGKGLSSYLSHRRWDISRALWVTTSDLTALSICLSAMEDAHAVVLDLEAANDKKNCFFAVYDGHSGAPPLFHLIMNTSSIP